MEYPPPLCFATQNIGEVAHSDGGVENDISSICSYQIFNPLALWALPLYSLGNTPQYYGDTAGGEVKKHTDSVIPIPRCSKLKYKGRV